MRVAAIAFSLLVLTMQCHASAACLNMAEARARFPTAHIYWHGAARCWDATPSRRGIQISRNDRSRPGHAKWFDAMSEMTAEDEPAPAAPANAGTDSEPSQVPLAERWVDIPQVRPETRTPAMSSEAPRGQLTATVSPRSWMLLLSVMAIAFTLAIVERIFRDTR